MCCVHQGLWRVITVCCCIFLYCGASPPLARSGQQHAWVQSSKVRWSASGTYAGVQWVCEWIKCKQNSASRCLFLWVGLTLSVFFLSSFYVYFCFLSLSHFFLFILLCLCARFSCCRRCIFMHMLSELCKHFIKKSSHFPLLSNSSYVTYIFDKNGKNWQKWSDLLLVSSYWP